MFDTLATPRNVDPSGWGQEDVLGLLKRVAELAAGSDEAVWKELIGLYAPALRIFVRLTASSLPEADVEDVVRMVRSRRAHGPQPGRADGRRHRGVPLPLTP